MLIADPFIWGRPKSHCFERPKAEANGTICRLQESSAAQQIKAERQAGAERLALLDRLHQAEREGLKYREQ
eukprot:908704-Karenia_brevis.AAC.1